MTLCQMEIQPHTLLKYPENFSGDTAIESIVLGSTVYQLPIVMIILPKNCPKT